MVKDEATLVRAYDDKDGVTAAFNLNILHRLNRELGANFDTGCFRHRARWNRRESRIEMHLESTCDQCVDIPEAELNLNLRPLKRSTQRAATSSPGRPSVLCWMMRASRSSGRGRIRSGGMRSHSRGSSSCST